MDAVVVGVVDITASAWPTLHDFTYSQPEYVSGLSSHLRSVGIVLLVSGFGANGGIVTILQERNSSLNVLQLSSLIRNT